MKIELTDDDEQAIKDYFNIHPETILTADDVLKLAGRMNNTSVFEHFFGRLCLRRLDR